MSCKKTTRLVLVMAILARAAAQCSDGYYLSEDTCCRVNAVVNPYATLMSIKPMLTYYAVKVASPPSLATRVLGTRSALCTLSYLQCASQQSQNPGPVYQAAGGYNNKPYLAFGKTSAGRGHAYLDTDEGNVLWSGGLAVVAVIRITERISGAIWSMQKYNEHIQFQIHTVITTDNVFRLCASAFNSVNTVDSFCTDEVPVNEWLRVLYTYDESRVAAQYVKVTVTYVNVASQTIALNSRNLCFDGATSNQVARLCSINYQTTNLASCIDCNLCSCTNRYVKYVLGYSAATDCSDNKNFVDAKIRLLTETGGLAANGFNCNRPNFDLAGFYLIQAKVTDTQISAIFQAIAAGLQIAYDDSIPAVSGCMCSLGYTGEASDCTACAVGTYKATAGSTACDACEAGKSTTSSGSTSSSECLCPAGYAGAAGSACAACALGTYKASPSSGACDACGAYKTTVSSGSTSSAACVCTKGPEYV